MRERCDGERAGLGVVRENDRIVSNDRIVAETDVHWEIL